MRKIIAVLLAISMALALVGCASGGESEPTVTPEATATPIPYADTEFVSAMKDALQARWDISNQKTDAEILALEASAYTEYMESCIDAERSILGAYPDKLYVDAKLQNLAKKYVDTLNDQTEALKYYSADWIEYDAAWREAYNERTKLILTLIDDYGLTVDEKYQSILDELSTNAQVVQAKEDREAAVAAIADQADFQIVEDEGDYGSDWHEYETVLENTSEETIVHYTLEVNLLDEDGVILETTYCSSINNWKPGTKAKLSFSTGEEFAKIEWTAQYYFE